MSNREAAPLTARLLARKRAAAPSDATKPQPAKATPRAPPAKVAPGAQNVGAVSPTVHAVDLTPPDFLRTENRDSSTRAHKRRDETS